MTNKKHINNNTNNIFTTASLYCDRVIEEYSGKADYFKENKFENFYTDVYNNNPSSITNIELFTYPFKGDYYTSPYINKGDADFNIDYCSNVIFSKEVDNIETTNNCDLELPKYIAIANIYVNNIKSGDSMVDDNNESEIIIYKNSRSFY